MYSPRVAGAVRMQVDPKQATSQPRQHGQPLPLLGGRVPPRVLNPRRRRRQMGEVCRAGLAVGLQVDEEASQAVVVLARLAVGKGVVEPIVVHAEEVAVVVADQLEGLDADVGQEAQREVSAIPDEGDNGVFGRQHAGVGGTVRRGRPVGVFVAGVDLGWLKLGCPARKEKR